MSTCGTERFPPLLPDLFHLVYFISGIPQIVILTKPDLACPDVASNLKYIYSSKEIQTKVNSCFELGWILHIQIHTVWKTKHIYRLFCHQRLYFICCIWIILWNNDSNMQLMVVICRLRWIIAAMNWVPHWTASFQWRTTMQRQNWTITLMYLCWMRWYILCRQLKTISGPSNIQVRQIERL